MAAIQLVDPENLTLPGLVLRIDSGSGLAGQGWTTKTVSSQQKINDTLTCTNANVQLTYSILTFPFGIQHVVSIKNLTNTLSTPLNFSNWDLQLYLHKFAGAKPSYNTDGTWLWENTASPPARLVQGFDTQGKAVGQEPAGGGMKTVLFDPDPSGGVGTGWQIWYSDDPKTPIGLRFDGRYTSGTTNHWRIQINPTNNNSGGTSAHPDYPIAPGQTFFTSIKTKFFPGTTKPDAKIVVPEAYTCLAGRWPLLVNQTVFPPRMLIGAVFLAREPDYKTNTGSNAPVAQVSVAASLPSKGNTFTVSFTFHTANNNTLGTNAQLIKAGSRVGFGTTMTGGVGTAPYVSCAVLSVSGSTMTLKNDDLDNAANAPLTVGMEIFIDFSYNPRRWIGADPTLKLMDPSTGKLFAEAGDYTGLNSLNNRLKGTTGFATGLVMGEGTTGTANMLAKNSGCTPGSAFGAGALIPWDLFNGAQYSQADPNFLGDPASALHPTLFPQVFVPELVYNDANFQIPIIEQACNYMGTSSSGKVYPNCFAGATFRADHLVIQTTANVYGVHQDFYRSLGDTSLGSDPSKVLYPSSGTMSDGSAFSTAGYPAPTLPSNQP